MVGFVIDGTEIYAGKHLLIDFYDCSKHGDIDTIKQSLEQACRATGATVLFSYVHPFNGGGCSGAVILAESHLSIHTWPEEHFVALDIFVCGTCDPTLALPILVNQFQPQRMQVKLERRGARSFD